MVNKIRKFSKFGIFAVISVALILSACSQPSPAPAGGSGQSSKVMNLFLGSTSTASSAYPLAVAAARVINKHVPEVRVTVMETGATWDNLNRMSQGQIQIAMGTSIDAAYTVYNGLDKYQGKAFKKLRWFYSDREYVYNFVVRADSNIKTLKDLQGKKFHVGVPGSSAESSAKILCQLAGVQPEWVYGSLTDAVSMVKEGKVVGLVKASPLRALDASIQDIKSTTAIRLISLAPEEVSAAVGKLPGNYRIDQPAGSIAGLPDQPAVVSFGSGTGQWLTTDISPDISYKMIKGIISEWQNEFVPVWPETAKWDGIKDSLRVAASVSDKDLVPLHAGVAKFFIEKGAKVPDNLLPPEFKK